MKKIIDERMVQDVITIIGDARHSNYTLSQIMSVVDSLKKLENFDDNGTDVEELRIENEELKATIESMTVAGAEKKESE